MGRKFLSTIQCTKVSSRWGMLFLLRIFQSSQMIFSILCIMFIEIILIVFLLVTPKLLENDDIDYKDILMYLIIKHNKPITVKQVLDHFKLIYGHNFPLKQFSCKTCMDFFRLNPAIFKVSLIKSYDYNSFN